MQVRLVLRVLFVSGIKWPEHTGGMDWLLLDWHWCDPCGKLCVNKCIWDSLKSLMSVCCSFGDKMVPRCELNVAKSPFGQVIKWFMNKLHDVFWVLACRKFLEVVLESKWGLYEQLKYVGMFSLRQPCKRASVFVSVCHVLSIHTSSGGKGRGMIRGLHLVWAREGERERAAHWECQETSPLSSFLVLSFHLQNRTMLIFLRHSGEGLFKHVVLNYWMWFCLNCLMFSDLKAFLLAIISVLVVLRWVENWIEHQTYGDFLSGGNITHYILHIIYIIHYIYYTSTYYTLLTHCINITTQY